MFHSKWVSMLLIICLLSSGCSHELKVRNLDLYKPEFIDSQNMKTVGIIAASNNPAEERLIAASANSLKRDGFRIIYPYYKGGSEGEVDYVVKINTSSNFDGSGLNFLINWPGFLIFAPALFGYQYKVDFNFDVNVTDIKRNLEIPSFGIPINLNVSHASSNRTWTEISWLEFSVIAFIGGIVFTQYDSSLTPFLLGQYEGKLGDYIGSKIARHLSSAVEQTTLKQSAAQSQSVVEQVEKTIVEKVSEPKAEKELLPESKTVAAESGEIIQTSASTKTNTIVEQPAART